MGCSLFVRARIVSMPATDRVIPRTKQRSDVVLLLPGFFSWWIVLDSQILRITLVPSFTHADIPAHAEWFFNRFCCMYSTNSGLLVCASSEREYANVLLQEEIRRKQQQWRIGDESYHTLCATRDEGNQTTITCYSFPIVWVIVELFSLWPTDWEKISLFCEKINESSSASSRTLIGRSIFTWLLFGCEVKLDRKESSFHMHYHGTNKVTIVVPVVIAWIRIIREKHGNVFLSVCAEFM